MQCSLVQYTTGNCNAGETVVAGGGGCLGAPWWSRRLGGITLKINSYLLCVKINPYIHISASAVHYSPTQLGRPASQLGWQGHIIQYSPVAVEL